MEIRLGMKHLGKKSITTASICTALVIHIFVTLKKSAKIVFLQLFINSAEKKNSLYFVNIYFHPTKLLRVKEMLVSVS